MINNPEYFAFNITNRCQSHCVTCNGWRTPQEEIENELSTEDWKSVLLEMQKWLGNFDFIFSGGEPFVRSDIFEIADFAKGIGLTPKVITNGLGLKNKYEQLIKSGFYDITVSINSIKNPNIHNESRGRKDAFKITFDVIQNLIYLNKKYNAKKKLILSTIIMPSNIKELPYLAEFAINNEIGINFQLLDGGISFFATRNLTEEWNKMFNEMKNEMICVIDKLKKYRQQSFLVYNTEEQFDEIKKTLLNSANTKQVQGENTEKKYDREGYDFSDTVTNNKINWNNVQNIEINIIKEDKNYIIPNCCKIGYRNFSIDPYGNVRICFNMEDIGSLKNDLPKNIWYSEQANKVREKIMHCDKPCKLLNCNYELD